MREAIRWTIELACREFGLNPRTLSKRLTQSATVAGEDRMFSTAQIAAAIYGDIDGEKLRKVREEADKLELANRKERGELIDVPAVIEVGQRFTFAVRQVIVNSKLTPEEKQAILAELAAITETDWTKRETYADGDAAST